MLVRTRTVSLLSTVVLALAAWSLPPNPPLRAADADASTTVEIRYTPAADGRGWAVAETADFRIYHNQSRELAEKAARIAEGVRLAAAKQWFGEALPAWNRPCEIYLYATAEDYSLATGQPPQVAGHSSFDVRDGRVVGRRIDLHVDDPNILVGVLPHETTHVVLAGRFGSNRLPRWADEGMAVLSEPRDRIELHLHNLPRHRRNDELFPVEELMGMSGYPDGGRIGPFYAESVSLVQFLSAIKGREAFARFLRDGMDDGYESALKKDFGIDGFDDLQDRWQRYAFGGG